MKCPICERKYSKGTNYCPNCNVTFFNPDDEEEKSEKKPFYKKTWFIILSIIIVVALFVNSGIYDKIVNIFSTSNSSTTSNSTNTTTNNNSTVEDRVAFIGETQNYQEATYCLKSVRNTQQLGDSYFGYTTNDNFVVITFTVTNNSNSPITIYENNFILFILNEDNTYSSYNPYTGSFVLEDSLNILDDVNPKITKTYVIAYEVPTRYNDNFLWQVGKGSTGKLFVLKNR